MGYSVFPAPSAASKTRYVETLTSGTSWTVPAGVTYINVTLIGGGGGAGGVGYDSTRGGAGGTTTFTGATSATGGNGNGRNETRAYGAYGSNFGEGGSGSTFASYGNWLGKSGQVITSNLSTTPGASIEYAIGSGGQGYGDGGDGSYRGGNGQQGKIEIEYWK